MKIAGKIKKNWLILGAVIIALGVGFLFFQWKEKKGDNRPYYRVEKREIGERLRLAGTVDAETRSDLGFARGGRVFRILAREGEKVKKGQLIAQIEQNSDYARYLQSQAEYRLTKVEAESGEEKVETSYEKVKEEQDRIVENLRQQYLSGDLEAVLVDSIERMPNIPSPRVTGTYFGKEEGVYRLEFYKSKAPSGYSFKLSGLESGYYPVEFYEPGKLGEKGLFIQFAPLRNPSHYNDTVWEVRIPNKRSPTYLERKTAYEKAVRARDRILSELKIDLASVEGDTYGDSVTRAKIDRARSQLQAQLSVMRDGKIIAPFSGTVVKNDLELGEIVSPLTPIITLFGDDGMKLVLEVPEAYVNRIREGDHLKIVLDAYPDHEYEGVVERIDPVETLVDGSPVYETDVRILEPDSFIRAGMSATAYLTRDIAKSAIAVPKHYLIERDGDFFVLLKKGDDVEEQRVSIGQEGRDGFVEILSGLNEGDVIILPEKDGE